MFKNYIFDWSGTLVDDLGPVLEATNAVLSNYGLPLYEREIFRRKFRLPYREFYEEILPGIALEELETHFRPAFDAAKSIVTVLPHAREMLEWAQKGGARMFVLTSMDPLAFQRQLLQFKMEHFFEATYAGALDKRNVIEELLTTHNLEKNDTAFIGDMTHDIETARHGGVSSIAVLTGYQHPEVIAQARPDITVPDLGVFVEIFSKKPAERPISTVGALIYNTSGKILLVRTHKWNNKWGIPGGKIERGETAETALKRETHEETGLHISSIQFVTAQDCIDSSEFHRPSHFILLNYLAVTEDTEVTLNQEAEEFGWFDIKEAFDLDLNTPTRNLLNTVESSNLHPPS